MVDWIGSGRRTRSCRLDRVADRRRDASHEAVLVAAQDVAAKPGAALHQMEVAEAVGLAHAVPCRNRVRRCGRMRDEVDGRRGRNRPGRERLRHRCGRDGAAADQCLAARVVEHDHVRRERVGHAFGRLREAGAFELVFVGEAGQVLGDRAREHQRPVAAGDDVHGDERHLVVGGRIELIELRRPRSIGDGAARIVRHEGRAAKHRDQRAFRSGPLLADGPELGRPADRPVGSRTVRRDRYSARLRPGGTVCGATST